MKLCFQSVDVKLKVINHIIYVISSVLVIVLLWFQCVCVCVGAIATNWLSFKTLKVLFSLVVSQLRDSFRPRRISEEHIGSI